jgi:large subunit ribosomal protein L3
VFCCKKKNMKAMLGRKLGMTQIFKEDDAIPVTLIEAGPLFVLRKLTTEKEGYEALQVGFEQKKKKKGYSKVKEIKGSQAKPGDQITVSIFQEGDKVKVSGISKGKGFQGGVKRHGFHGRKATHGVKHEERAIGSVGSAWPQRVIKGRRMPGRMGAVRVATRNLKVVQVDAQKNLIVLKGAVPGRPGTLLFIEG